MGEIRITFGFKSVSIWILFGASVQRPCGYIQQFGTLTQQLIMWELNKKNVDMLRRNDRDSKTLPAKLVFTAQNIAMVNISSLDKFIMLTELYLDRNYITELPEGLLKNNTGLRILDLSGNQLKRLPNDLLTSLPELKEIHFDWNRLEEVNPELFCNNRKLEVIKFYSNKIKTFHTDTFKDLPELKVLSISGNKLNFFDFATLSASKKLVRLSFYGNKLTEIVDYDKFHSFFPKLKAVVMKPKSIGQLIFRINVVRYEFTCSYLKAVLDSFDEQLIAIVHINRSAGVRPNSVYGIACLPNKVLEGDPPPASYYANY